MKNHPAHIVVVAVRPTILVPPEPLSCRGSRRHSDPIYPLNVRPSTASPSHYLSWTCSPYSTCCSRSSRGRGSGPRLSTGATFLSLYTACTLTRRYSRTYYLI